MKLIVTTALICLFSTSAFARNLNWNKLETERAYDLAQEIKLQLDDSSFKLPKNTEVKLIEVSSLTMIKVILHKFKLSSCPSENLETDLELISIQQAETRKTTVGVNLASACILEVFVEAKDVRTKSFLQ